MVFPVRRSLAHKMLYTDAPQPCNFTLKILENRRKTTIGPFWLNQLLQDAPQPTAPIPGAAVSPPCPCPPYPTSDSAAISKSRAAHMNTGCTYETVRVYDTSKPIFGPIFDINAVSNFHRPTAPSHKRCHRLNLPPPKTKNRNLGHSKTATSDCGFGNK